MIKLALKNNKVLIKSNERPIVYIIKNIISNREKTTNQSSIHIKPDLTRH